MKFLTLINCSLTAIITAITIPCLASSLREIDLLSTLLRDAMHNSIPTQVFNGVLQRRVDKINEFDKRNNLTTEELVFCDIARHSLNSMQVLLNTSSGSGRINLNSNLLQSYHEIVASFHTVFDNERTSTIDYEPALQRNTRNIGYYDESLSQYCGCYPVEEETPRATKTSKSKSKILMLIDDYISDFNLYVDYRLDRKPDLSVFIGALETLKRQISDATGLDDDLEEYNRTKLTPETMKVSWVRFECIVKMFLNQAAKS